MADEDGSMDAHVEDADRQLRRRFSAVRDGVEGSVDVEARLAVLHRVDRRRSVRSSALRRGAVAAAVAAIVVGALVVAGNRSTGSDLVADAGSTATSTGPGAAECVGEELFVYFVPGATDEQIQAVSASLRQAPAAGDLELYDTAASYEEFTRLFRDQPDLIAAIDPEDLPQSVRVTFADERAAIEAATRVEAEPAVLRAELPRSSTTGSGPCSPLTPSTTTIVVDPAVPTTWTGSGASTGSDPVAPATGDCESTGMDDIAAALPARFDPTPVAASTGTSGGPLVCARYWSVPAEPGVRMVQQEGDVDPLGVVVGGSAGGFTWGTVHEGHFLRHDGPPVWNVVAYGVTATEWDAFVATVTG